MTGSNLIVTERDRARLLERIEHEPVWSGRAPVITQLKSALREAEVTPSETVPHDVVTMNSTFVRRDLRTGQVDRFTLVYPEDASPAEKRISVLSPAGLAVLGARERALVAWADDEEARTAQIGELVYQPEAAGDFDR